MSRNPGCRDSKSVELSIDRNSIPQKVAILVAGPQQPTARRTFQILWQAPLVDACFPKHAAAGQQRGCRHINV